MNRIGPFLWPRLLFRKDSGEILDFHILIITRVLSALNSSRMELKIVQAHRLEPA